MCLQLDRRLFDFFVKNERKSMRDYTKKEWIDILTRWLIKDNNNEDNLP